MWVTDSFLQYFRSFFMRGENSNYARLQFSVSTTAPTLNTSRWVRTKANLYGAIGWAPYAPKPLQKPAWTLPDAVQEQFADNCNALSGNLSSIEHLHCKQIAWKHQENHGCRLIEMETCSKTLCADDYARLCASRGIFVFWCAVRAGVLVTNI